MGTHFKSNGRRSDGEVKAGIIGGLEAGILDAKQSSVGPEMGKTTAPG